MKSLFSCILRKKGKSKIDSTENSEEKIVINHVPLVESVPPGDSRAVSRETPEQEIIRENQSAIDEQKKIEDAKKHQDTQHRNALINRLNSASMRIENVSFILNGKYSAYCLRKVIDQFDELCSRELQQFVLESGNSPVPLSCQAELVRKLFDFHKTFLTMINGKSFGDLSTAIGDFRSIVIEINQFCNEDSQLKDLNRLLADSILIFGWLCVFERPAKFIQNNLDGYLINITRLLNDNRFIDQHHWLKLWAVLLKRFSAIVTQNFQAALMWGLPGPVPTDVLQCLIECNYSRGDLPKVVKGDVRKKVIKTTTVDDMSYESMTSLMDDLRSGRHRSRLRPVAAVLSDQSEGGHSDRNSTGVPPQDTGSSHGVESEQETPDPQGRCVLQSGTWIVEHFRDQSDLEISNTSQSGSVVIRKCNNCSVQVSGTVQSLRIDHCQSLNIILDEIVGSYDVSDCSNIESQVFGNLGKVNLESVSQFRLFLGARAAEQMQLMFHRTGDIDLFISKVDDVSLELDDYTKFTVETRCRTAVSPAGGGLSNQCF